MMDEYKEGQVLFYNTLKNSILKDRISHAYLFDTKGNGESFNIIMSFVKTLICPNNYFNKKECGDCILCKRIDEGNYPEIKQIFPDGLWIKKNQLLELQEEFNKKCIEGDKRIYIIFDCEKLNSQAANSILKFLEEPENGIVAILVTNNINMVMETIRSRCQIITLINNKKMTFDKSLLEDAINFVTELEKLKKDTIIYEKELWLNRFKERSDILNVFDIMICYYNDLLQCKIGKNIIYFEDYKEKLLDNSDDIVEIARKIDLFIECKELIKKNISINLLLDRMIIEFGGE